MRRLVSGEELVVGDERLGRGASLHVGLVRDRDVLRPVHVPAGCAPAGPYGERRDPGILALAVDVDVVRHVRAPLRGHGPVREVVVHHRGAERVRDHVHVGLASSLLERRDRVVDLLIDLALVRHRARRVVVDLVDPALWVAVAHEAHRLRLELGSGAFDAVNEEDRVLAERRLGRRLRAGRRCGDQEPDRDEGRSDETERGRAARGSHQIASSRSRISSAVRLYHPRNLVSKHNRHRVSNSAGCR